MPPPASAPDTAPSASARSPFTAPPASHEDPTLTPCKPPWPHPTQGSIAIGRNSTRHPSSCRMRRPSPLPHTRAGGRLRTKPHRPPPPPPWRRVGGLTTVWRRPRARQPWGNPHRGRLPRDPRAGSWTSRQRQCGGGQWTGGCSRRSQTASLEAGMRASLEGGMRASLEGGQGAAQERGRRAPHDGRPRARHAGQRPWAGRTTHGCGQTARSGPRRPRC